MKSHSSKAPRKSFDVTKMSGPDIAAEMARHMAEFKSGRRPSEPATARKETSPSAPQSKLADHRFLRASLAAEGDSAPAPSKSRDGDFDRDKRLVIASESGQGLAFLRRGTRFDGRPEIIEREPAQHSRGRSSYRAGLLAGAGLALAVIATASAALWKSGALPDFLEAHLPEASLPIGVTNNEKAAGAIASTDQSAIKDPPAVPAQPAPAPTPPTPIVLMVTPAPPPPIMNPALSVDTLSAITAVQPDAPAVDLSEADVFQSAISDHGGAGPAITSPQMAAPAADHPAGSAATNPTLRALKQLAERPSLKPDLDVGQLSGLEGMTAATASGDEANLDPYVVKAKPFISVAPSSSPSVDRGETRDPAPTKAASSTQAPGATPSEASSRQTLSPLPPPIIIQSAGKVGNIAGAASVEISEQPVDGDQQAASSRHDPNHEANAGREGGLGIAGARSDGTSASARGGDAGGDPSGGNNGGGAGGGGTDPGGDGGTGGGTPGGGGDGGTGSGGGSGGDGGDGGSGSDGGGGDGGGSDGGDGGDGGSDGGDGGSDGGDGGSDGGDGGSDGGDGGGSDGGDGGSDGGDGGSDGGDGGSDGGDGGSDGGDGGSDGGGGADGGDGGGDSDGGSGSDGGGDTDGGSDSGDSDGGEGGDSDGGDGGSTGGGGLGGALGGALGGGLGGLGGN